MDNEDKKKKLKELAKIFTVVYLISFFVMNWNDVSWIFNYRTVWGLLDDFFTPYESTQAYYSEQGTFYPNHSSQSVLIEKNQPKIKFEYSEKNNLLEIPKIGLSTPIIFSQSTDQASILKDLDKGVVYYPGSVLPEENGQIIILGHSAPPNWPKIKHDWVFSEIENLVEGDQIFVYIGYKKYTYTVKQKSILKRGQDITPLSLSDGSNYLSIVSCWPPGKDLQRITVQAEVDME